MKLYLAGPMSGYPDFNLPAFFEMARRLRARGYEVVSPPEEDSPETQFACMDSDGDINDLPETWGQLLGKAVPRLVDDCDGIALMRGWKASRGCLLELTAAVLSGKNIFLVTFYEEGFILARCTRAHAIDYLHDALQEMTQ